MKKTLYLLLAAAITLGLFSACDKSPETPVPEQNREPETDPLNYDYDLSSYITVGEYLGLDFDESACMPTDDELQSQITKDFGGKIVNRAAQDGDTVHIDYVGTKDGVAFEGGTASDQALTLGSHTYIEGFEEGLIGVMPGETVELNLSFPEEYPNSPDLAGKPVVFTVTVRYIEDPDGAAPELSDELVRFFSPYENQSEYLDTITRVLFLQKANATLWKTIWNGTEFLELPSDAVEAYYNRALDSYSAYAAQYGYTIEDYVERYCENTGISSEEFYAQTRASAEEDVQYDLVLQAIKRAENLSVTDEDKTDVLQQLFVNFHDRYGFQTLEDAKELIDESVLTKNELYYAVMRFVREHAAVE